MCVCMHTRVHTPATVSGPSACEPRPGVSGPCGPKWLLPLPLPRGPQAAAGREPGTATCPGLPGVTVAGGGAGEGGPDLAMRVGAPQSVSKGISGRFACSGVHDPGSQGPAVSPGTRHASEAARDTCRTHASRLTCAHAVTRPSWPHARPPSGRCHPRSRSGVSGADRLLRKTVFWKFLRVPRVLRLTAPAATARSEPPAAASGSSG